MTKVWALTVSFWSTYGEFYMRPKTNQTVMSRWATGVFPSSHGGHGWQLNDQVEERLS